MRLFLQKRYNVALSCWIYDYFAPNVENPYKEFYDEQNSQCENLLSLIYEAFTYSVEDYTPLDKDDNWIFNSAMDPEAIRKAIPFTDISKYIGFAITDAELES